MQLARRAYKFLRFRLKVHRPFQLAAEIAYFFLLATQPLLIVLTALLAYLPLKSYEPRIASFVADTFPGPPGERLAAIILSVLEQRNPRLMSVAAVALLWTASSGTKAVIDAVTRIRGLDGDPRPWLAVRLRATALTVGLIVLLALGAAFEAGVMQLVHSWLGTPAYAVLPQRGFELALGFLLMTSGVQLVYVYGPPPPRGPALPGAVVAVLSAVAASSGLSYYVKHFRDLSDVYGSLGALVLLVLWFYVVGCALVLGAEVNAALAELRQKRAGTAARRSLPVGRQSLSSAS